MECPIDGYKLEPRAFHGTIIDECVRCKGLWLNESELRKAKDEYAPDQNWLDFDLWSDQEALEVNWSSLKCPQCQKNMAIISYADTEVTIDYCADRHGIWLDKGEFQAIIEALDKEIASKDISGYITASFEEAKEIIGGDEGIISEWEDFMTITRLFQYRVLVDNPKLAELLTALQKTSPFQ